MVLLFDRHGTGEPQSGVLTSHLSFTFISTSDVKLISITISLSDC